MMNKFKTPTAYMILLVILLLPLLLINVTGRNGWGGDFSQYIQQAININENKAQADQYYIFNDKYSELAPPSYYPGFPIMISPIIVKYGVDYKILAYFMSVLLILLSIVWFWFLKIHSSSIVSIFAIILVVYSPYFLSFKNQILADFPFTIFVSLSLLFFLRIEKNIGNTILNTTLLFLSTSLAILIKPLGLSLLFAYMVYLIIVILFKLNNRKKIIYSLLTVSFLSFLVYTFFVPFLLKTTAKQDSHFIYLFDWQNMKHTILGNLDFYYNQFLSIFYLYPNDFLFFNTVLLQVLGLSFLYGLYKSIKKKVDLNLIFILIYLSIVLLFPYQQGARYLIPILIILVHYTLVGFKEIPFSTIKKKYLLIFLIIIGYLLPLRIAIVDFAKTNSRYVNNWGPTSNEAKETFAFIINNIPESDVIVFHKPRVLGLYTRRKSFSNQANYTSIEKINADIYQYESKYILTTDELNNNALNIFLENKKLDIIFENDKYCLYYLD